MGRAREWDTRLADEVMSMLESGMGQREVSRLLGISLGMVQRIIAARSDNGGLSC